MKMQKVPIPIQECKLYISTIFILLWNLNAACNPTIPKTRAERFKNICMNFCVCLAAGTVLYAIIAISITQKKICYSLVFIKISKSRNKKHTLTSKEYESKEHKERVNLKTNMNI